MIDPLLFRLDVAVKHGGIRAKARLVRFFRGAQPHLAARLVVADNFSYARMKDFRASAGAGIDSRLLHFVQDLLYGKFGDARKVVDFHHGEGLDMHSGAALFEAANQFQVMIESQVWMQATDDVKFSGAFANALFRALIDFFERKRVRARSIGVAAERAKSTVCDADV